MFAYRFLKKVKFLEKIAGTNYLIMIFFINIYEKIAEVNENFALGSSRDDINPTDLLSSKIQTSAIFLSKTNKTMLVLKQGSC